MHQNYYKKVFCQMDGCDGGDERFAFNYVRDNGGIDTEDAYPYKGEVRFL